MTKKKTVLQKPAVNRSSGGRSLNMGICSFFAMLFETNELTKAKKHKLTNEQIEAEVRKEYPDRKGAFFAGKRKGRKDAWGKITVNTYRQKYNKGVFTQGIPPEHYSFRYDNRGLKVDTRTGKRLLLPEEIEAIVRNHKEFRDKVIKEKL